MRSQCPDGTPAPCGRPAAGPNAVAVLAFRNVTRDTALAYLGEGLSSEIARMAAGAAPPMQELPRTCFQIANNQAWWLLAAGQPDSALAAVEACTPRGPKIWFFLRNPVWDVVRATTRFQRLRDETRPPGADR